MEPLQKGELAHAPEQAAEGLQPSYIFTPRAAGYLACGELAVEPLLGPARVTSVNASENDPDNPYVHVGWRDEHGPSRATCRYPAHQTFDVRMPGRDDRMLVRRSIDQARWHNREITGDTARLIAAHLHPGAGSALHRFMIDGSITERAYDELEQAARHRRYARTWVDALTRYCLAREDPGPVAAWTKQATAETEARAEEWLTAAGIDLNHLAQDTGHAGSVRPGRHRGLFGRKHMSTETAVQLIEAAFLLGRTAARSRPLSAAVDHQLGAR